MRRLPPVLVAVMLAVAVSVGSAGPVLAAKGGNNDNAHACQQGGHVNRFEAETGNPFKNAGDCASHGAQGGAIASLQVLADIHQIYRCPHRGVSVCWGSVSGSGLGPGLDVLLVVIDVNGRFTEQTIGVTDATGSVSQKLNLPCVVLVSGVFARVGSIESATVSPPAC